MFSLLVAFRSRIVHFRGELGKSVALGPVRVPRELLNVDYDAGVEWIELYVGRRVVDVVQSVRSETLSIMTEKAHSAQIVTVYQNMK